MPKDDAHDCGACNRPNSADVGMVSCDGCKVLYHYTCAKVSPGVLKRSWRCSTCQTEPPAEPTGTKKRGVRKQSASLTVLGAASSEIPKSSAASQKDLEKSKASQQSKTSEKSITVVVPIPGTSGLITPKKNPEVPTGRRNPPNPALLPPKLERNWHCSD